jgi:hypothetical protein
MTVSLPKGITLLHWSRMAVLVVAFVLSSALMLRLPFIVKKPV